MFTIQTLKDFLENPMGKGSNAISNKQLVKTDLIRRFDILNRKTKIKFDVYKDADEYYFHFIIPSESERNNTYDVILHFTMGEEDFKFDNFLNRYYVKFFSNCPSFTFTFAYAFNLHGLLIEQFGDKFGTEVLDHNPVMRNPGEVISYEKSIFFACHHIFSNKKYMSKMILNELAKPYKPDELSKKIRNIHKIKLEVDLENRRLSDLKKEKEKPTKKESVISKAIRGVSEKNKIAPRPSSNIKKITPNSKHRATSSTINRITPK